MAKDPKPQAPPALEGEVGRLRWLRDELWMATGVLTGTVVDSWTGAAKGNFDSFRLKLARRWWEVGSHCDHAATVLEDYQRVASELRGRMALHGDARLLTQVMAAASQAGHELNSITEQLDGLRRLLDDAIDTQTAPAASAARPVADPPVISATVTPPERQRHEPARRSRTAVHELFARRVESLNAQLLVARVGAVAL